MYYYAYFFYYFCWQIEKEIINLELQSTNLCNMIRLRIEEILRRKSISKTQFAELCGIQKQNVNALLDTSNIKKLQDIANILEVKLTDLIAEDTTECASINGYIEFNGEVYSIKSIEDLHNLVAIVNSKQ